MKESNCWTAERITHLCACFGLSLTFILTVGCGAKETPVSARQALAELNVKFTPDAFLEAVSSNDKVAVQHFLTAGMAPSVQDHRKWVPLLTAAYQGHTEIVEMLIDAGADDKAALARAASQGHLEIVKLLAKRGWDANRFSNGRSALGLAAQNGHVEVVRHLLKQEVDLGDLQYGSALHVAVNFIHPEVVEALLKAGADPNEKCIYGTTPLSIAKEGGDHTRRGKPGADMDRIIAMLEKASGSSSSKPQTSMEPGSLKESYKTLVALAVRNGDQKLADKLIQDLDKDLPKMIPGYEDMSLAERALARSQVLQEMVVAAKLEE